MKHSRLSAYWWLLAGGILLLILLGVLQYRWIVRASEAERQERLQFLRSALSGVRNELTERLQKPAAYFRSDPEMNSGKDVTAIYSARFRQWRSTGSDLELVRGITIGWIEDGENIRCLHGRSTDDALASAEWPASLVAYRAILQQRVRMNNGRLPFFPEHNAWVWGNGSLVLVLPVFKFDNGGHDRHEGGIPHQPSLLHENAPMPPPPMQEPRSLFGWCFIEIEQSALNQIVPELVNRYFGESGIGSYEVALLSDRPSSVIYQSTRSSSDWHPGVTLDEEVPVFFRFQPPRNSGTPEKQGFRRPEWQVRGDAEGGRAGFFPDPPLWRLVARHKAGSLNKAVAHDRRLSLGLSSGVLLLLMGSAVLLVLSTQQARILAKRQMEFVAGVSHELRTPLAVIQSTSYNLAQGKVNDFRRVQQYGEAIQKEVRRLTVQVEQVLGFAGIESGRKLYNLQPVDVQKLIDRGLAEYSGQLEGEGWKVERRIEPNLPAVLTDPQVLESVLKNLLQNSLKYAGQGKWLGITLKIAGRGKETEVLLSVADHGPGIDVADLPHIFEPFYRGRKHASGATTPGVGLGLSLVERHLRMMGGNVTVRTVTGEGTEFTLHLPVAQAC